MNETQRQQMREDIAETIRLGLMDEDASYEEIVEQVIADLEERGWVQ